MGTGTPGLAPDPGVTVVGREVGRWHRLSRTPLGLLLSLGFPTPSHSTVLPPPAPKSLGCSSTLSDPRKPCRASQHRLSSSISLPCPTFHLLVEEAVPNQEGEGFVLLALLRPKAQAPKGSSGQPPAGLTFQSIRDAPKTQHGLGAPLNLKEREQSSCQHPSVSIIYAWEGEEQGTTVCSGSLSMHGAGLKPRSSGRCNPECNLGAVIWDQPQKCLSRGLKHHQNHGTQPRCMAVSSDKTPAT